MTKANRTNQLIRFGFVLAGLVNIIGILTVTHGMTSTTLVTHDPAVFSQFGIIMIMVWGLAYIASARLAMTVIWLPAVFAIEKLAYTLNWVFWIGDNGGQVSAITEQDFLGGFFLGGYGINDGLFCLFFAAVAFINWRRQR